MKKIFDFKKLLNFGKKESSFLGVDIGASSIKVVQLKKKKGIAILETYGELSLGPYMNIEEGRSTNLSAEQISEALKNLLTESNVSVKKCGVSIPLKSSLVFTMEMPNIGEVQLNKMIPIEVRKYIPVPISEVDLDWKIIPRGEEKQSSFIDDSGDNDGGEQDKTKNEDKTNDKIEILVVAIHKDTIQKQKDIISGADLILSFLEIEIFSTIRAVVGQGVMNFSVLDMGSGATKMYVVERGVIRDSHLIDRGSQDITLNISRAIGISVKEAEEYKRKIGVTGIEGIEKEVSGVVSSNLEYIFIEANKLILNYQKKYNKNIEKLIIAGGGAIIKGLPNFVSSHLEIDFEIADPFSRVESPAFLNDLLKQVGPEFSVALGVALRGVREFE